MAIRRLMMMGLSNWIRSLIAEFRTQVNSNQGIFESEDCMYNSLDLINKQELLGNATNVYTPNSYADGETFQLKPSITNIPIKNLLWNTGLFNTTTVTNNATSYAHSTSSTDPFGGIYSNLIAETTANTAHSVTSRIFPYVKLGVTYTFSVYLKKGNGITAPNIVQLNYVGGFPVSSYANFNISTGTVIRVGSGTASITNEGNGWFRCSISMLTSAVNESTVATICLTNNTDPTQRNPTYTGQASSNIFAYGMQVEEGNSVTSYQEIVHPLLLNNAGAVVRLNQLSTKIDSNNNVGFASYQIFRDTNNINLSWTATRASFTYNSDIAPDGTLTAHRLIENNATGTHFFASSNIQTFRKGTPVTFSIYAKTSGRNWIYIQYFDGVSNIPSVVNTFFDLSNGTVGTIGTGVLSASIEDAGNGWYRCIITRIKDSVPTNVDGILFNVALTTSNGVTTYTGDNISGVIFWQPQLVTGTTTKSLLPATLNFFPKLSYNDFDGYNNLNSCPKINLENSGLNLFIFSEEFNRGGNLVLQSQDWTQAVWSNGGATIVSSLRTAPDGTSTATELSDINASSSPGVTFQSGINATSTSIVFSIYTKNVSSTTRRFLLRNSTTATNFDTLVFDYSSVGNLGNGWFSEDVGSGWFRLSYVRSTGISVGNLLAIYHGRTGNAAVGATDIWQVWGAQVEPNERLTEYTRTTTGAILGTSTIGITITSRTELSPNPDYLADTLTANNNDAILIKNAGASTSNTNRIFSVYLKRKTGSGLVNLILGNRTVTANINSSSWTRVYVVGQTITGTYSASTTSYTVTTSAPHGLLTGESIRFDATSGTAPDQNIGAITVTSTTQFTFNGTSATTSGSCNIFANSGKINISTSGDEIYVWGAQMELVNGSLTIPLSYIPSYSSSSITTLTDVAYFNIPTTVNKTVFIEIKKVGANNNTTTFPLFFLGDNLGPTFANNYIGVNGGATITMVKRVNQVPTTFANPLSSYGFITNKYNKFAFVFNGTNVDIWIDGALQISTAFTTPQLVRYLTLIGTTGLVSIGDIYSWSSVLSTSQLQRLTYNPYFTNGTTELTQLIGRGIQAGTTLPSDLTLQALDIFIETLKSVGVWDKLDAIYNFAYNNINTAVFSRLNLKSTLYPLSTTNMSYGINGYLVNGTGVNSGFLSGYQPGVSNIQFQPDDHSRVYILYQSVSGAQIDSNSINGANFAIYNDNVNTHRDLASTNLPQSVDLSGTGLKSMVRSNSNTVTLYNQSSGTTLLQVRNANTGTSQQRFPFTGGLGMGFACFGASLTQTDINTIRNAYNTYLSAIGLTPFA